MPGKRIRILCLALLLPALGVAALHRSQSGSAPTETSIAEAADSIYALVVAEHVHHVGEGPHPATLVFEASTIPYSCFEDKKEDCATKVKENLELAFDHQAEGETIKDYLTRNKSVVSLPTTFHTDLPKVFITTQEISSIFKVPKKRDAWENFYKKYPKSGGFLAFSLIGFNSKLDQAIVYSQNSCGWLCGAGFYNLLKNENGKWVIVKRYMAWIS